jgi:aminoglycoside 2'-N-acetyltransferase I
LSDADRLAVRALLWAAFGTEEDERFTEDDWDHATGGVHFVLELGDLIVAHAAVVERRITIDERSLRTGYVEAVATAPDHQREGHGSRLMRAVGRHIDARYELGVLGTGAHHFYERLGWTTWRGPAFVRTDAGLVPTADDHGFIMVLRTRATPPLEPGAPISCAWRSGDVW